MSPAIHNAAYRELGLDFVYLAFGVKDVKQAVAAMKALDVRGYSVTIPHKIAAMELCDELGGSAERLGALNTIVNEGGVLKGHNTDGPAAIGILESAGVKPPRARAVVLGVGGAGLALALALVEAGTRRLTLAEAELAQCKRFSERQLPGDLELKVLHCDDHALAGEIKEADLLINCSPVGMHPKGEATPVPAQVLHKGLTVFDLVYNPRRTRLLKEAEEAGAKIIDGLVQLVEQAALQFKLFTGEEPPREVMIKAAEGALKGK